MMLRRLNTRGGIEGRTRWKIERSRCRFDAVVARGEAGGVRGVGLNGQLHGREVDVVELVAPSSDVVGR